MVHVSKRRIVLAGDPAEQFLFSGVVAEANCVMGDLWMGSAPPIGTRVGQHFSCLVLCAKEYQPHPGCFPGVRAMNAPFNDDGSRMTTDEIRTAVRAASQVARWLSEKRSVLVTCHMGLNRSGVVCALALMIGPSRLSAPAAVAAVREARGPHALSNPQFLGLLGAVGKRMQANR